MCSCGHGSERHYLDYAGPGICGGILTRCTEEGCPCSMYKLTQITSGGMWPTVLTSWVDGPGGTFIRNT